MKPLQVIERALRENRLGPAQYALARLIAESVEGAGEFCLWVTALVSAELARGNVCVDMPALAAGLQALDPAADVSPAALRDALEQSPVIGDAGQDRPLVLDRDRLYLNRYFHNEAAIAARLLGLKAQTFATDDAAINAVFPGSAGIDRQQLAAWVSCRHRLAIISGGPGTGKTWAVSRILEILRRQNPALKVRLAAPTGKAAARINESMASANGGSESNLQAVTLHRLLGIHRYSHRPRHDAANPLPCDLLVVDEASMIDQRMMAMLLNALAPDSRLILLGDKDQLSSVEAGSVFADLCGQAGEFSAAQIEWLKQRWPSAAYSDSGAGGGLADHVVVLDKSRRFAADSAIGRLARNVNDGDVDASLALLGEAAQHADLGWRQPGLAEFRRQLGERIAHHYRPVVEADSLPQAFARFDAFRILSPLWGGHFGVNAINAAVESDLKKVLAMPPHETWFRGRAVMITRNLAGLGIYNGDTGLVWPDENGRLRAWFATAEHELRPLSLSQLNEAISAWAMTVHKSQGSEYREVLLLLPGEDNPVLSRELLYTGLTRAVERLELWGSETVIRSTIQRRTERMSGLRERLA